MSGGGGSSTSTTQLDPVQREALETVLGESKRLYNKGPLDFYPGETVAGSNQGLESGIGMLQQGAGMGSDVLMYGEGAIENMMAGPIGADTAGLRRAIGEGMDWSVMGSNPELQGALTDQLGATLAQRGAINTGAMDLMSSDILSDPRVAQGVDSLFASSQNIVDDPRLAGVWNRGFNASNATDPRTLAAADAATAPLYDKFTEEMLPAISSRAMAEGAFGGDRSQLAKGTAAREVTRAAGETRADFMERALRAGQEHERGMVSNFISGRGTELQGLSSGLSSLVGAKSADLQAKAAGVGSLIDAGSRELDAQGRALGMGIDAAGIDAQNYANMVDSLLGTQQLDLQGQVANQERLQGLVQSMPTYLDSLGIPGSQALAAGDVQRGLEQERIDADRERWEFEEYGEEAALDRLANRVLGMNFGGTTITDSDSGGFK